MAMSNWASVLSTSDQEDIIRQDLEWRASIIARAQKAYLGVFIIYFGFIISTAAWFVVRAKADSALAKRSTLLTMIGFVGNLLISFPFLLIQATPIPCFVVLWCVYLGIALTIFSLSARAWRLKFLFRAHQLRLVRMKLRGTTADAAKAETRELEVSAGDVGRGDDKALGGTTLNALPHNASGSGLTGNVSGMALVGNPAGSTKDFAGNISARSISNHSRSTYIPPSFRGGVRSTSIPGVPRSHVGFPQKALDNTRTPLTYDEAEAGGPTPVPASEPLRPLLMLLAYTLVATTIWIIIVTVISPRFSVRPISYECNMGTWETLPVLCFMGLFFMIGCPALTYWIWKDNDTYGIKRDLVTFAIAGTTVAVMYLLEQTMVPTGKNYGEPTLRLYFGAANWPVIGLLVGHVTSIFLPVLASHNIYPMRPIKRLFRRYRTPSANSSADNISTTRKAKRKSKTLPKISWALFASILEDTECFEKFKEFAARDFAAENPLFYEEYRKLMEAVKEAQAPPAVPATIPEGEPLPQPDIEQPSTSNESISKPHDRMSLTDKYPVFDFTPTPPRSFFSAFLGIFPFNRNRLSHHPSFFTLAPALPQSAGSVLIPPSLLPAYLTFYKTFIARGAPCQVNLSSHVLENITRQLEREGVLPLVSVFDEAKNAVLDMMYEMFPRFVEAEEEGVLKRFMKNAEKGTSGSQELVV